MKKTHIYFLTIIFIIALLAAAVFLIVSKYNTVINLLNRHPIPAIVYICCIAIAVLILLCGIMFGKLISRIKDENAIRRDALSRSRAVLSGLAIEQVAPFLPDFPCSPSDARFIGKPVDFIAFPGMTQSGKVNEVLLIEVKSGSSNLSDIERQVKSAVEKGHVRYVQWRLKN